MPRWSAWELRTNQCTICWSRLAVFRTTHDCCSKRACPVRARPTRYAEAGITGLILVPTNSLKVDLQRKYPGWTVVTVDTFLSSCGLRAHFQLFGYGMDDQGEATGAKGRKRRSSYLFNKDHSAFIFDEMMMYPLRKLQALQFILPTLPKNYKYIWATGDRTSSTPSRTSRSDRQMECVVLGVAHRLHVPHSPS